MNVLMFHKSIRVFVFYWYAVNFCVLGMESTKSYKDKVFDAMADVFSILQKHGKKEATTTKESAIEGVSGDDLQIDSARAYSHTRKKSQKFIPKTPIANSTSKRYKKSELGHENYSPPDEGKGRNSEFYRSHDKQRKRQNRLSNNALKPRRRLKDKKENRHALSQQSRTDPLTLYRRFLASRYRLENTPKNNESNKNSVIVNSLPTPLSTNSTAEINLATIAASEKENSLHYENLRGPEGEIGAYEPWTAREVFQTVYITDISVKRERDSRESGSAGDYEKEIVGNTKSNSDSLGDQIFGSTSPHYVIVGVISLAFLGAIILFSVMAYVTGRRSIYRRKKTNGKSKKDDAPGKEKPHPKEHKNTPRPKTAGSRRKSDDQNPCFSIGSDRSEKEFERKAETPKYAKHLKKTRGGNKMQKTNANVYSESKSFATRDAVQRFFKLHRKISTEEFKASSRPQRPIISKNHERLDNHVILAGVSSATSADEPVLIAADGRIDDQGRHLSEIIWEASRPTEDGLVMDDGNKLCVDRMLNTSNSAVELEKTNDEHLVNKMQNISSSNNEESCSDHKSRNQLQIVFPTTDLRSLQSIPIQPSTTENSKESIDASMDQD